MAVAAREALFARVYSRQARVDPGSYHRDRRVRFWERSAVDREDVLHPRPDIQRHINARHARGANEAHGVVEQRLIAPDDDQEGRQAREVGMQWGGERRAGIGAVEVLARHALQALLGDREIHVGARVERLARAGQIYPRGERRHQRGVAYRRHAA
jgi:hypothetical protein